MTDDSTDLRWQTEVFWASVNPDSRLARDAVVRYTALEQDALRLTHSSPLTIHQARSLLQNYSPHFAEQVGGLLQRGWHYGVAVEVLSGGAGMDRLQAAIGLLSPRLRGAVTANPETPCGGCRNYDHNPYLNCAVHPLGRPGHECGDWEDNGSREAAIEVVSYNSGDRVLPAAHPRCRCLWVPVVSYNSGDRVLPERETEWQCLRSTPYECLESEEIEWQIYQAPDGTEHRVMQSRTRYRHYADGRVEIVPEEPVQLPPRDQRRDPDAARYGWLI